MSTTWFLCLDILYVNCKNLIAFTLNVTGSVSTIIFRLVLGQCACRPQYWVFGTVCLQAQVLGFWDSVPASTTTGVLGQCACKHKYRGFRTVCLQAPELGFWDSVPTSTSLGVLGQRTCKPQYWGLPPQNVFSSGTKSLFDSCFT